jgi:hypothetical protein
VFGKGGKVRYLPAVDSELRLALERHILDRQSSSEEFLLYPEKLGPQVLPWPGRRHLGRPPAAAVIDGDAPLVVEVP